MILVYIIFLYFKRAYILLQFQTVIVLFWTTFLISHYLYVYFRNFSTAYWPYAEYYTMKRVYTIISSRSFIKHKADRDTTVYHSFKT